MQIYTDQKYVVIAKEWRDKTYGNSYFSARVSDRDGNHILVLPKQYGYGNSYEYEARQELSKLFSNPKDVCKSQDLYSISEKIEGCLKRDVVQWGLAPI